MANLQTIAVSDDIDRLLRLICEVVSLIDIEHTRAIEAVRNLNHRLDQLEGKLAGGGS